MSVPSEGSNLQCDQQFTDQINKESNHLLIFNVPDNAVEDLLPMFGKLKKFQVNFQYSALFTCTYHAVYKTVQSARLAKRVLNNKKIGNSRLEVQFAPELETAEEARRKMLSRKANSSNSPNLYEERKMSQKVEKLMSRLSEEIIETDEMIADTLIKSIVLNFKAKRCYG